MQGYTLMSVEYLAGLFDADGCASSYVQRSKKSNKTVQVHSCEISMTNKEVVYWVKDFLGFGNIHYRAKVGGMGKKPQWRYRASHRLALKFANKIPNTPCLLYTSPSPRDGLLSRMPSSA